MDDKVFTPYVRLQALADVIGSTPHLTQDRVDWEKELREIAAAIGPDQPALPIPVAYVRWGEYEPQLAWNKDYPIWDSRRDAIGNLLDFPLFDHAPTTRK